MLPTPNPVDVFIGLRNRPIVWRVPMVSAKVPAVASSTSQTALRVVSVCMGHLVRIGCVFLGWLCQQMQHLIHHGM